MVSYTVRRWSDIEAHKETFRQNIRKTVKSDERFYCNNGKVFIYRGVEVCLGREQLITPCCTGAVLSRSDGIFEPMSVKSGQELYID